MIQRLGFFSLLSCALLTSAALADRYVARANQPSDGNYLTWGTAASNIADAVSASAAGETIWVSNGVYTLTGPIYPGGRTLRSFNNGSLDRDGTVQ